jgi:hypothetical protein
MASDSEKHVPPTTSNSSDSGIEVPNGSINEKRLLRKLDLRLLPAVSILYLLSFLDRSNGRLALLVLRAYTDMRSCERTYRRPDHRPENDRQPIPYWTDTLFPWLRLVRTSMQHHTQANDTQVLASYLDYSVGHRCDAHGRNAKPRRFLCRALLVGSRISGYVC